jgi:hypothetical protein
MVEPPVYGSECNEAEKRAAECPKNSQKQRAHNVPGVNNGPTQKCMCSVVKDLEAGPSAQEGPPQMLLTCGLCHPDS